MFEQLRFLPEPNAAGLIIDSFAGLGGASVGITEATGREVSLAINHSPKALAVHEKNHPGTHHVVEDVHAITPERLRATTGGAPVGLLWASPDCTHFSKAKSAKPRSKKIRGLAWTVLKFAWAARPQVICLENVTEFEEWGPLTRSGRPCKRRRGETFQRWVAQLRGMGYAVEWRRLKACDFGAPTIRTRLFVIARRDGRAILWPQPSHGPGTGQPYRSAAEIIDWSLPCPSIFERKRPLADATLRRVAKGIQRYVMDDPNPFIVKYFGTSTGRPIHEPLHTVTTSGTHHALVVPTLIQTSYGERQGQAPRVLDLHEPLGTIVGSPKHALVVAFLAKHFGGMVGCKVTDPLPTVTTKGCQTNLVTATLEAVAGDDARAAEVAAFLIRYNGLNVGQSAREPLGTATTKPRFALVTVHGVPYRIDDIGMRLLTPRELARAQGFPDHIILDAQYQDANGKLRRITKTDQYALIGNSVCPPVARAVVSANLDVPGRIAGRAA